MSLCIGCMHEIGDNIICPDCGFDNSQVQSAPFIPYGAVLDKRYVVGKNLDTNGESTSYIGFDRTTQRIVYIREFLPVGYYSRGEGSVKVNVDPSKRETYDRLISDFEQYFSFLSTLKDMSAMNVITDIFRANNTCYVIEEAEELISFEEYVERNNGHIEWEIARPLFMPVISLLETLHKNGYGHYAVSPSNMYIPTSGKVLLMGFATINERRRGTALKSQLFSGCAAPEQYENNFPIDNITDIYGFTATLFYALTGTLPNSAKERLVDGALLMSTNTVKRLPPHVVSALANGLQVKRENRIIDFGDLRSQLSVEPTMKAIQEEISRTASMAPANKPKKKNFGMAPVTVSIITTVAALLVFLWIGITIVDNGVTTKDPELGNTEATVATETPVVTDTEWKGERLRSYVGQDFDAVSTELSAKGVSVFRDVYSDNDDGYSDSYPKGTIMSQNLPEGTPLDTEKGLVILFKVSKGSAFATLPDVENMSLGSAVNKLTASGFVVYRDSAVTYSNTVDEGKVIGYKDHRAGESVSVRSSIYLIVSSGKKPAD